MNPPASAVPSTSAPPPLSGAWKTLAVKAQPSPAPIEAVQAQFQRAVNLKSPVKPGAPGKGAAAQAACTLSEPAFIMAKLHGHLIANGLVPSLADELNLLVHLLTSGTGGTCASASGSGDSACQCVRSVLAGSTLFI